MSKSHAAGMASVRPTLAQLSEACRQADAGRLTAPLLAEFLGVKIPDDPNAIYALLGTLCAWSGTGEVSKARLQNFLRGEGKQRLVGEQLLAWERFYFDHFGWRLNFYGLRVPHQPPVQEFDPSRLLVIAHGLTNNLAYDACVKKFPCWRHMGDLNVAVPREKDQRHPQSGTYAIWVRDVQEADECWKNHSALQLVRATPPIKCETLLERLIHELVYYSETMKHLDLDLQSITLCAGSRSVNGYRVPSIHMGTELYISWSNLEFANNLLRCREVVA